MKMFINKNIHLKLQFIRNETNLLLNNTETKKDAQVLGFPRSDKLAQHTCSLHQGCLGPAGVDCGLGLCRPVSSHPFIEHTLQEEAGQEGEKTQQALST